MRKKISILCILSFLLILLAMCGCSDRIFASQANRKFNKFTQELFCQEISGNALTLHYTLKDPDQYGIRSMSVSLGSYTADTASSCAALENCLAALHRFNYDNLSEKNQLTYDVLEDYLKTALMGAPYALYEEPLSPLTGIQAQLPVLLSEYTFYTTEDIDTYLELLACVPEYFDSLIEFERAKSSARLFMSSYTADSIIKECDAFLNMGDSNYLLTTFASRLDQIPGLNQTAKESYISKNASSVNDFIYPAYKNLSNSLQSLRSSGNNTHGLCHYPDGSSYYEYLVRSETGSSRSITELQDLTKQQMTEDLTAMQEILQDSVETIQFTLEDSNPTAILSNLKQKMSNDFPSPPDVNVETKYVSQEMENFLSPAFYMIPPIDNIEDNVIYINQSHLPDDLELYTTLAHEGYPGHLYQTVYYASTEPDPVRNILSFGGYTEGWATYSEMLSHYYTTLPKSQALLTQRNSSVILGLYALADIGIHYDGWTLVDTVAFFREYGITDNYTIESIYDLIVADPANYLKYYIGYVEILDLKKEAMKEWGDKFTQKRFHKAVLDTGPASFDVLRKHVLGK